MFIYMQKFSFISNFFFEILSRHCNFATYFGNFGNGWTLPSKSYYQFVVSFYACLKILWRNNKLCFEYFAHVWPDTWQNHFEETLDNYQQAKNQTFTLCTRYCKDINLLFWVFGYVWLCTPKVILSIFRKYLCLSSGKISISKHMLFWRWCKDMQMYFGYFGHA